MRIKKSLKVIKRTTLWEAMTLSASKGCSELVISSYRKSFFSNETYSSHKNAIASARAGNVIGGGDWSKDRLVPDAIKSFSENNTLLIRILPLLDHGSMFLNH